MAEALAGTLPNTYAGRLVRPAVYAAAAVLAANLMMGACETTSGGGGGGGGSSNEERDWGARVWGEPDNGRIIIPAAVLGEEPRRNAIVE